MSINFDRKGKITELNPFCVTKVIEYLATKLNTERIRIQMVPKFNCGKGVLVIFDNVNFIMYADITWFKISFDKTKAENMNPVIEALKEWNETLGTGTTSCVEIEDRFFRAIVFEQHIESTEEILAMIS